MAINHGADIVNRSLMIYKKSNASITYGWSVRLAVYFVHSIFYLQTLGAATAAVNLKRVVKFHHKRIGIMLFMNFCLFNPHSGKKRLFPKDTTVG